MAYTIQCPQCQTSLTAKRAPRHDKLIECLKCGYRFTHSEATRSHVTAVPPTPPRGSYGARMLTGVVIGGVAIVVLMIGGLVAAYQASRPALRSEPVAEDIAPKPAPVAKAEPKIEPKATPKPEPEPKPEPKVADSNLDSNKELFQHLMIDGGIATHLKKYDEAVAAYAQAEALFPQNVEVQRKLAEARAALDGFAKQKQELEQNQADAAALIRRGQAALDKEQFAAAIDFFKLALQKCPTSDEAAEQLIAAQERMHKGDAQKKKLDEFDQRIRSGKAALQAGRFAEAAGDFVAAGRLMPNDPLPGELLKEAEKRLEKAPLDQGKRVDDRKKIFDALLIKANNALRLRNLEEAEDAFKEALRLSPADPTARRGLEDAEKALKQARAEVANLLAQAQNAVAAQQLPAAMNFLRDAQRLLPNNPDLVRALRAAELIQANQVAYYQSLTQANNAMALHLYADAVIAYTTALQLVPDDPYVAVLLLEAQRRLANQNVRRRDYDVLVAQGLLAVKNQRYLDAKNAFGAALLLVRAPVLADPQVQSLYRYSDAMTLGYAALNARQFVQAGRYFQAALVEIPNDPAAFLGLQKAQFGNKGRPIS